ncbi:DUF6344 domain-containing protein [Streptomyces sp. WAC06614]|uniref:DUF6344 domain-containing protein n=1 Tax=Streptomyces sp. WAC06614 TaxID=2487416 RepID=UPI000F7AF3B4|nr:DUF6344 domain-containing protein [Streptomyces sp. WAC06614]RSS76670.1 hypothetical protein EF918_23365 [Streptomyces sp. WAC06614]
MNRSSRSLPALSALRAFLAGVFAVLLGWVSARSGKAAGAGLVQAGAGVGAAGVAGNAVAAAGGVSEVVGAASRAAGRVDGAGRAVRGVGRRSWRQMMRGGALPPTIAQRIRAEAHGSTPSVRRSTTAAATVADRDVLTLVA